MWIRMGRLVLLIASAVAAACGASGNEGIDQAEASQAEADAPPTAEQVASASQIDWEAVEAAMGRSGATQPGDVFKFGMPRTDLNVTSAGVPIAPALALGSWLAFKPRNGTETVAMGDLVLTEEEYSRVVARLQEGGVGQTAVHKHLPEMSPPIWWTHIHAEGNPVEIATTVRAALELSGTPPQAMPAAQPAELALDTAGIREVLGYGGNVNGGVYQISVPRAETIRAHGVEVPPSMGTGTVINFQPTGEAQAAIAGDFVMIADEVQPVIRAFEENGITVVALHNHMLAEEPRLFFLHFWANDDAVRLARGLRAALDQMNVQQGPND